MERQSLHFRRVNDKARTALPKSLNHQLTAPHHESAIRDRPLPLLRLAMADFKPHAVDPARESPPSTRFVIV